MAADNVRQEEKQISAGATHDSSIPRTVRSIVCISNAAQPSIYREKGSAGRQSPFALRSLGLLLRFERLNLAPLAFDFTLLLIDLRLGLRLLGLLVLHRVAYRKTAHTSQSTADGGPGAWRAHCGADYRASRRAQPAADQGAFFARRKRLPAASQSSNQYRQTE
jgi:hypothetical protein